MNKTYRTIWNTVKQRWVVVAENVKGYGGPAGVVVLQLVMACLLASGTADALPVNPQVVSGTATFANNGSTLTITNSANAIINWQKFSVAANETTRFMQPSALSAVLNRVTGGDPSVIYGALQSNGRVFLINQNGILFGPGARVDVNGLVASTLNLSNEDFLAGRMRFAAGPVAGRVENQGVITTPSGGQIYLIAPDVQNSGIITAPNGDILLAAGKEVLLVDQNAPEIAVVVTAPEGQALNVGTLTAEAGRIGLYGSVVRQAGVISANSAVQDAHGRIFLRSTQQTTLVSTSTIEATGSGSADGGKVVVWSDGTTVADGRISVRAGSDGGNGGFIETSGAQIDFSHVKIDASASRGRSGLWLIDPTDLVIDAAGASALTSALDGSNVSITTTACNPSYGSCSAGNGDITVASQLGGFVNAGANVLTLTAERDILVNAPIVAGTSGLGGVVLNAAQNVVINKPVAVNSSFQATASAGSITFSSLDSGSTNGTITTSAGSVMLNAANGGVIGSSYGYVTEITAPNLDITTKNGINYLKPDIYAGITFSNTGTGNVRIYNQNSSGLSKTLSGSNAGGNVIYESNDVTYSTSIGSLSASGDIILRTNKAPTVSTSVGAGGKVYLSSFNNSPVLPLSIEGAAGYNLTSANLNKISAGAGIVIGNDNFGNITPSLSVGASAAVGLSGPKQFEFWGQTITTGNNTISLAGAGSGLTFVGALSGGQISFGSGLIDVTSGTVKVRPASPSAGIFLGVTGSAGLNIPSMGNISAQSVEFGVPGASSGALLVEAPVATSSSSPHILHAGSAGVSQLSGATLSIPSLGITAYGDVLLPEANTVGSLAATTTGNLRFNTTGNLNLGLLGGLSGVTSGGQISLTAGGTVTQSAGALLTSTTLRVNGMSVVLNEANPVGVLSGGASGVGANDRFEYTSVNQITLDTVDGVAGVSAAAGGSNPLGVRLVSNGQGINQNPGATVQVPGRRLELSAGNDIMLADPSNTFSSVAASSTSASAVTLASATSLAIPYLGAGIATINAGSVGGVQIAAPSLNLSGEVLGAGSYLMTDNLTVAGTAKVTASDPTAGTTIAPATANRPITVGAACVGGIPCLLLTDVSEARFSGGNGLAIGESDPAKGNLAGNITIAAAVSRPTSGLALLTGGSISQTAPISSLGVVAVAGGAVNLSHASNAFGGVAVDSAGGGVSIVSGNPLTVGNFSAPGLIAINGITSSNSPISISSTGGVLDLQAPVDAGTGPITLGSAGALNASGVSILGSQLTATANGGISIDGVLPQISLTNSGSGDIWYGGGASTLASVVNSAPGGMVSLSIPSGNLTLTGISTNNGDLAAYVGSGTLTINGNLSAGTGWINLEGGNVSQVAGTISAQSVELRAITATSGTLNLAGIINATQSIDLKADNLVLNSPTLTVANTSIQNEISIRPTSAGRSIIVGGTGSGLNVTTTSTSVFSAPTLVIGDDGNDPGSIAAGPITVVSSVNWPQRFALVTGSTVTQNPGASITANEFGVLAGGNVTLTDPGNAATNFVAELAAGSLTFSNSLPFSVVQVVGGIENPRTITGVSTAGGNVNLTSTGGGIILAAPIDAGSGAVTLSAAGSILDSTGSVGVYGGSLSATAGTDIGSLSMSLFSQVSQWTKLTAGGSVYAENYGAVSTSANAVTASGGEVLLKAHSPLTIGTGGVTAQGNIYLEAMLSGSTDDLTINGPLASSSGSITLIAGANVIKGIGASASAPGGITVTDQTGTTTSSGFTVLPSSDQTIVPADLQPLPPDAPLYTDPASSGQGMVLVAVTTSTEPTSTVVTETAATTTTTDAGVTNGAAADQQSSTTSTEQGSEEKVKDKEQKAGDKPSKEDKPDAKPKKKNYCN